MLNDFIVKIQKSTSTMIFKKRQDAIDAYVLILADISEGRPESVWSDTPFYHDYHQTTLIKKEAERRLVRLKQDPYWRLSRILKIAPEILKAEMEARANEFPELQEA